MSIFFDIFILPAFLRISFYPAIDLSPFSISGDHICPPEWEGFEGLQLNESMSKEGGYFRECDLFPPSRWHLSQVSLCFLTLAGQWNTNADLESAFTSG